MIILRHKKENLRKCSLRGLEGRSDLLFFTYPQNVLPDFSSHLLLHLDGPPLSEKDHASPLLLIDGTWKYADIMLREIEKKGPLQKRSIPPHFRTAYPRKQTGCPIPDQGLASVEALYIAYLITGKDPAGLLDHYHWRDLFLKKNRYSE